MVECTKFQNYNIFFVSFVKKDAIWWFKLQIRHYYKSSHYHKMGVGYKSFSKKLAKLGKLIINSR